MFGLGAMEIVFILVLALIVIGPKKLPELARNLGKGVKDFQDAAKGLSDSVKDGMEDEPNEKIEDSKDKNEAPQ